MKGQIIAFDLVASVFMLVLFLSILAYMWTENSRRIEDASELNRRLAKIVPATEILLSPNISFLENNLSYLKIAVNYNVINYSALINFLNVIRTNYTRVKAELGLLDNYYFEIYNVSSNTTLYREPNISATSFPRVNVVTRFAILNNTIIKLVFGVIG